MSVRSAPGLESSLVCGHELACAHVGRSSGFRYDHSHGLLVAMGLGMSDQDPHPSGWSLGLVPLAALVGKVVFWVDGDLDGSPPGPNRGDVRRVRRSLHMRPVGTPVGSSLYRLVS